jgi:hypothetical protein
MMSRLIVLVICMLGLSIVSCGDRCSTVPADDEPRLVDLQFSAQICNNLGVDSHCRSLELFSQQLAMVKAFKTPIGGTPYMQDSLIIDLQNEDLVVINDLLDRWDDYESFYFPGGQANWPTRSCALVRYAESSSDTISIFTLNQETTPATPEPLREAVLQIDGLIGSLLCDEEARDWARLERMGDDIRALIGDPLCTGSPECRVIGFGSKPCGGAWEYLIYSVSTVDTVELARRVAEYNEFEAVLNRRYDRYSDCSVPNPPNVGCRDGRCVDLGHGP